MATPPMDLYSRVPLLTDENFQSWSKAMEMVLIERGLHEIVLVDEKPPEADEKGVIDEALMKDFTDKGKKALACIYLNITPKFRSQIDKAKDGKEAWIMLKRYFEPDSLARVMKLKHQFWTNKLVGEEIAEFAARQTSIADKLAEAEEPVSQLDQVFQLLRYLPDSYEGMVQTIYRRPRKDLQFDKILTEVLAEQARLNQRQADKENISCIAKESTTEVSSSSSSDITRFRQRPKSPSRRCYECGSPMHLRNKCPQLKKEVSNQKRSQSRNYKSKARSSRFESSSRGSGNRKGMSYLSVAYSAVESQQTWVVDTASTDHVCKDREAFSDFQEVYDKKLGSCVNDLDAPVKGKGTVIVNFDGRQITLNNVLYVPNLRKNLISGYKLDKGGAKFIGGNNRIEVVENGETVFTAIESDGLYVVEFNSCKFNTKSSNLTKIKKLSRKVKSKNTKRKKVSFASENIDIWHKRFAHINPEYIKGTARHEAVRGLPKLKGELTPCDACKEAKARRVNFKPKHSIRSKKPLELLHLDLCGPMPKASINGHRYFLGIVDDFSRKVWTYPLKSKSDTFPTFKIFLRNAERFTERKVKAIRTDNGLEFVNDQFRRFCEELGITHEKTNPYTPEQNGVAERFNYTAVNGINVLLRDSNLSQGFWAEALRFFSHNWNRIAHGGEKTPCELYSGQKPSVYHLRPFGAKVFYGIPKQTRTKFDLRAKQGILVGYAWQTKGYRVWIPDEHRIIETVNVRIDESTKPQGNKNDGDIELDNLFPEEHKVRLNFPEERNPKGGTERTIERESSRQKADKIESKEPETSESELEPTSESDESTHTEDEDSETSIEIPPKLRKINWNRKPVPRKNGSRTDVYYYPEGSKTRLRSLKDVKNYCERENLVFEKSIFDFSSKNPYKGLIATDQIASSSSQHTKLKSE